MSPISSDKPLDRRQKKTRFAIQNALLTLMQDKPIERITVTELAAAADVDRKTFYNHYRSLSDVRTELEAQHVSQLLEFIQDAPNEELRADPNFFIEKLVTAISENMDRTKLIFDSGEHYLLAQQFSLCAEPVLTEVAFSCSKHPEYLPYVSDYMVNGLVHLMENWIRSENPLSPKEFANIAVKLIRSSCSILEFDNGSFLNDN